MQKSVPRFFHFPHVTRLPSRPAPNTLPPQPLEAALATSPTIGSPDGPSVALDAPGLSTPSLKKRGRRAGFGASR